MDKALSMIEEVVSNKKQKEKQRQAQYERKRDEKRRDRYGGFMRVYASVGLNGRKKKLLLAGWGMGPLLISICKLSGGMNKGENSREGTYK